MKMGKSKIFLLVFPVFLAASISQIVLAKSAKAAERVWPADNRIQPSQTPASNQAAACNRVKFQDKVTVKSVSGPVYFRAIDQPMCRLAPGQRLSNTGILLADAQGQVDLEVDNATQVVRVSPRQMLFVEKSWN